MLLLAEALAVVAFGLEQLYEVRFAVPVPQVSEAAVRWNVERCVHFAVGCSGEIAQG